MPQRYNPYNQQVLNRLNEFKENNEVVARNIKCSYLIEIKNSYKHFNLSDKTIQVNIENVLECLLNYFNSIFSNIQDMINIELDNRKIDCLLYLKMLDIKYTSDMILEECSEYIDIMENLLNKIEGSI